MNMMTVQGMMCNHCRQSVQEAVARISGVGNVEVSLEEKCVRWDGDAALRSQIAAAVKAIGFQAEE